jgi:hypothetical protein
MRRKVIAGLAWALVAGVAFVACDDLSEEECLKIRGEAYDIVNDQNRDNPHTCADDTDCFATEWPGCPMPVNTKNKEKIDELKKKFDKGGCKEPASECPETPLMYCKQGLCVKKHEAGEKGKTTN